MRFLIFVLSLFFLASCKEEVRSATSEKNVRFMFQNAVGLNLEAAGCSMIDLGGASRMCERIRLEKPTLFFQVGPAFSFLIPRSELSAKKASAFRKALVGIWNVSQVKFYSVDTLDLLPSLEAFQSDLSEKQFSLLSTNIRDRNGKAPFQTFHKASWNQVEFFFLGFSAPQKLNSALDWQALSFRDALEEIEPVLKQNASAQLIVLGSLAASQREEVSKFLARPAYFIGGALEEENTTEWTTMGQSFWGKAVDLGRGTGKIEWSAAPSGGLTSAFSSKALRKDLNAVNQCTKIAGEVLGSSR